MSWFDRFVAAIAKPAMNDPKMEFWTAVALICAGGALGGLAAGLIRLNPGKGKLRLDDADHLSDGSVVLAVILSVIVGMSGAAAVQFALIFISGATRLVQGIENKLFMFSISTAAGFGARSLLPVLSASLRKQIKSIDERTRETKELASELKTLVDQVRSETQSVDNRTQETKTMASELKTLVDQLRAQSWDAQVRRVAGDLMKSFYAEQLDRDKAGRGVQLPSAITPGEVSRVLSELDGLIERDPKNYHALHARASIYVLNGDLEKGEVEFKALVRVLDSGTSPDADKVKLYDSIYNLACISGRRYKQSPNDVDFERALVWIRRIFAECPRLIEAVHTDGDFATLREREAYKTLHAKYVSAPVRPSPDT